MVTLEQLEDSILAAKGYYVQQIGVYNTFITSGGLDRPPYRMKYLGALIRAIEPDFLDSIITDNTQELYGILLKELANYNGSASINPNFVGTGYSINVTINNFIGDEDLEFGIATQSANGLVSVFYIAHGYTVGGTPTIPPYYGVDGQNQDALDGTFNVSANTTNLILTYTGIYPYGNPSWEYRVSKSIA